MEIIIVPFGCLKEDIIGQIADNSPWEGLKKQIVLNNPIDIWVKSVKENISSVLLSSSNGELISYGCFGNKGILFENIVKSTGFELNKTFVGIYLFTVKKYQNQGYAEKLKNNQIKYIQQNYLNIKYLLGTTSSKELLNLYEKYGAKKLENIDRNNKFLIQEGIGKDYFYYYEI